MKIETQVSKSELSEYLPEAVRELGTAQQDIPRLSKDPQLLQQIEAAVQSIPTHHHLYHRDARCLCDLPDESVHLVLTSPPYWTLKQYRESDGQMGAIADYEEFLSELDQVWEHCYRALVPGGRLVCVVGDVCLSRRQNKGRHTVVPLHASIQEHCRHIGFDNLAPIIWYKIANAKYEGSGTGTFLGKPFEPNAVIKNDIEFILMQRKPGGYRTPSIPERILSVIGEENYATWFQQIWTGLAGASTRHHPAPYPLELAERLVRMFSFVGDTILDPFMGTASTNLAAGLWGRNSIGVEVDALYFLQANQRMWKQAGTMFTSMTIERATTDAMTDSIVEEALQPGVAV